VTQKGSEGNSARAFSPRSASSQVCHPAVPDIPAQPGSTRSCSAPSPSPGFSALSV